MIETDTIEEVKVGQIGFHGLQYVKKVLLSCPSLRVFHAEVVDLATLTKNKATLTDADYDYSGHKPPPPAEDAEPLDEEGEEFKKLEQKKKERLKKLTDNDYDSDNEEVKPKMGTVTLPGADEVEEGADLEDAAKSEAAQEVAALLASILDTFVETPHILDITLEGDPASAVEEELRIIREERANREDAEIITPGAAVPGVQALLKAQGVELGGEKPVEGMLSALPVRGYFNRKASAALSEALFECQRYKSQQNTAVMDAEGEMAFVAMYLRRYLSTHKDA
jgi:hypothetical protein